MIKFIVGLFFAVVSSAGHAAFTDAWPVGYFDDGSGNKRVWSGPGFSATREGSAARGGVWAPSGTAMTVVENGVVSLGNGRAVTLTATRLATAGALAAAAARLASGPYGLVATLALPAVYDWIMAEGQQNIRVNPGRTGVEKKDPKVCSVSPCYIYGTTFGQTAYSTEELACNHVNDVLIGYGYQQPVSTVVFGVNCVTSYGSSGGTSTNPLSFYSTAPESANWLPASMDDIAPYMTPRLPSQTYPNQIIAAGGEIDVTPVSITGPSPALSDPAPHVLTTQFPAPADTVSERQIGGNPFYLPDNTPRQTGSSSGSQTVNPGSSTTSGGSMSSGSAAPVPKPVQSPSHTVDISTFNPTTNTTTTVSTTKVDPQTQVSTTTNVTNITNTTNTSTVTNSSTTTTTTTNNTTNTTNTTTDETPNRPNPLPEPTPAVDPCIENPDRLGCVKLGEPPAPEELIKKTTPVEVNPVAFSSSSSCPSPVSFMVIGTEHSFSYAPLCERLAQLKFLFLAMAGMIAAWSLASLFKV